MEKLPKPDNKYETHEGEPTAELEAAVDQLDSHAIRLEREGSDVDVSPETAERVEKKVGKIRSLLKVASMALALYGTYEVGSYATSRYEIATKAGQDGKKEYEHEDPETTRILNFLTGKEGLASEDRIHFYRQLVTNEHDVLSNLDTENGRSLDERNIFQENLPDDEQGLRNQLLDIYSRIDMILYGEVRANVDERVNEAFDRAVQPQVEYNADLEKMVWEMQIRVGAPRLRWAAGTDNLHSQIHGSIAGPGRANYSEEDNTIYITPGAHGETLGSTLLAENAHAFQFNEHPITSRIRYVIDTTQTLVSAIRENKSYYVAQHEQYDTPGSIEYEAHQVLEKQIMEETLRDRRG